MHLDRPWTEKGAHPLGRWVWLGIKRDCLWLDFLKQNAGIYNLANEKKKKKPDAVAFKYMAIYG